MRRERADSAVPSWHKLSMGGKEHSAVTGAGRFGGMRTEIYLSGLPRNTESVPFAGNISIHMHIVFKLSLDQFLGKAST